MNIFTYKNEMEMAVAAADFCETAIKNAQLQHGGTARILLSTGASQLPFFEEFIKRNIDFSSVEMFHLDEYIGVDETHIASFKKYLTERFTDKVSLKKIHFIDGMADPQKTIASITEEINKAPIDLGLIGIGENAHIAFNDPPADFSDPAAYKIVTLSETCKAQQVREGWFENMDTVCKQAISMTCQQIMKCKKILSIVPYTVKAQAIYNTLTQEVNVLTPATLLKQHSDFTLMLDENSASLCDEKILEAAL